MSVSPADILTTQKNGVVAISNISQTLAIMYAMVRRTLLTREAMATSYATVYTSPTNTRTNVVDITVCNTAGSGATVSISFVPSGGTAGADNALYYDTAIAANDVLHWVGEQVLNAGDTIQCEASATTCTISITGAQST